MYILSSCNAQKRIRVNGEILELCWKDNQVGLADIQNLDPSTTF